MLDRKRAVLMAVGFVLVVIALEVAVLKLGSLELPMKDVPTVAEQP